MCADQAKSADEQHPTELLFLALAANDKAVPDEQRLTAVV